jgi:amino-acid N-acetyltransferase
MQIFHRPPECRARALLVACDLPTSDLASHHFDHFLGCGTTEALQGIVGLEIFGALALLRSLAVAKDARGSGCGKALVAAAETYAKQKGVRDLYLLTTTAERFFARLGYLGAERDTAPVPIQRTREFADLCPDSAVFMVKHLAD